MLDDKHNSVEQQPQRDRILYWYFLKGTRDLFSLARRDVFHKTAFRYIPDIRNVTTAAISEYYKDKEDDVIIENWQCELSVPGESVNMLQAF